MKLLILLIVIASKKLPLAVTKTTPKFTLMFRTIIHFDNLINEIWKKNYFAVRNKSIRVFDGNNSTLDIAKNCSARITKLRRHVQC